MRCFKFVILFIVVHSVAQFQTQVQAQVPSHDDRVVSFSFDAGTSGQYTPNWNDFEEDSIFAPNSVDPLMGGPTPALRFIGKGALSAIETDAISYGYKQHPRDVNLLSAFFSVSRLSEGFAGTAVHTEAVDDRGSDIFASELTGVNRQVYDGNGLAMQPGALKLGLAESVSTNLDALDMRAVPSQFLGIATLPNAAFYWSVADKNGFGGLAAQPEYAGPGYTGRDIFYGLPKNGYANNPAGIHKYADGGQLGLTAGDDIDALVVIDRDGNPGDFDPLTDAIIYSLTGNSTSLSLPDFADGAIGKSGGDIFQVGGGLLGPNRFAEAVDFGLDPMNDDDLDALDFAIASMVDGYISTVPEPASMLLVIVGLALLPRRRRGN